jgi:cytochrome oxidase Cu insertion factor (SCO1/SenC/PrrC family)
VPGRGYPRAVAANDPSVVPRRDPVSRLRWALWALVPVAAAAAIGLYFAFRSSEASAPANVAPVQTWGTRELKAPDFRLSDQYGKLVSIGAERGRAVILTFVDPHCTTFCPRESIVLNDAIAKLPAADRPAIFAVNVNPPVSAPAALRQEARRFKWLPQWRWATGSPARLRAVWSDYHIQVIPTKNDIGHTEAAYVIDGNGDQRALFLWPFHADDVAAALQKLS